MYPYQSQPGFWGCGATQPPLRLETFPATSSPKVECGTGREHFVDLLPSDVAVSLNNVTLTIAG